MTVSYLDASAVVKLLRVEAQTSALEQMLATPATLVSCQLLEVEVICVARRQGLAVEQARAVVRSLMLIPMDSDLVRFAQQEFTPPQRALDALHLATALHLGDALDDFVSYDRDQIRAARDRGLVVHHPGLAQAAS